MLKMTKNNFHINIALFLSFLILSNYLFLAINFSELILKINFIFFLLILLTYYFKYIKENIYLKIFFLAVLFICLGIPISEWDPRSIWFYKLL